MRVSKAIRVRKRYYRPLYVMLGKASIPSLPSFLSHFLGKYKQESEWKIKDDAWEGNRVEEEGEG